MKTLDSFAKVLDRSECEGLIGSVVNANSPNWVDFATKTWKDHTSRTLPTHGSHHNHSWHDQGEQVGHRQQRESSQCQRPKLCRFHNKNMERLQITDHTSGILKASGSHHNPHWCHQGEQLGHRQQNGAWSMPMARIGPLLKQKHHTSGTLRTSESHHHHCWHYQGEQVGQTANAASSIQNPTNLWKSSLSSLIL